MTLEEQIFINSFCIVIASHLSNSKRILYLIECLESLLNQTIPISIYLSISFNNDAIREEFLNNYKIMDLCNKIFLVIREHKTPQMRHIYMLSPELEKKHKWIMFCDDDDSYDNNRVEQIIKYIYSGLIQCSQIPNKKLIGLYESTFGKDHREHRHEYWCYCINIDIIRQFYEKLADYPDIIDNKCCDVLFAEYLRRANENLLYSRINEKLYNYRVDNNSDSITGFIKGNQTKYIRNREPPSIMDISFSEYVVDWNEYLYENLDIYLHDVFLRTIVGSDLDFILKSEFKADYAIVPYTDNDILIQIKNKHEYWRELCNNLYDIKFVR